MVACGEETFDLMREVHLKRGVLVCSDADEVDCRNVGLHGEK